LRAVADHESYFPDVHSRALVSDPERGCEDVVRWSVRYLELRGLLERQPDQPHIIRILEEEGSEEDHEEEAE
jgi:hypothetical protein